MVLSLPTLYTLRAPTAAEFQQILDVAEQITTKAEVDWSASFALGASITAPTKGSSTYAAKYRQVGGLVHYSIGITIGAGFGAGSGDYRFSLPVTASAAALVQDAGSVWVNDSGTALRVGIIKLQSTTTAEIYLSNITGAPLGSTGPGTAWGTNDSIVASLWYEAA